MTKEQRRIRAEKARARRAAKKAAALAPKPVTLTRRVSDEAISLSRVSSLRQQEVFAPAAFPDRCMPPKEKRLAMDSSVTGPLAWAWGALSGLAVEGQTFLGFPYLSELSQRPEYRRMVEQLAFHMTRRWIKIKSKGGEEEKPEDLAKEKLAGTPFAKDPKEVLGIAGERGDDDEQGDRKNGAALDAFPPADADAEADPDAEDPQEAAEGAASELAREEIAKKASAKAKKIKELEDEFDRLKVRQHFKEAAEQDGFFGRSHIYIDLGTTEDANELATPIGNGRNEVSQVKIKKGALKGLKVVEPIWVYPMSYEAVDPLSPKWYRPDEWYVMRRNVHRSRLLTFVSREVPDLLKPAYAFGGVPLTQLAKPYVDNWLRTRQSVSDLIQSFSQFVIQTDVLAQLSSATGASELFRRLDTFNNTRNNRGVMAVDKEREDLKNVSAPLGSLDALQAQSHEQLSSVTGIPILFLLGDQPSGLNASSEGSIRAFYDWIKAGQEFLFKPNLDAIFAIAQINIWGKVDEDLEYEFVPLWQPTDKELSDMRKSDSDRDSTYIADGVLHPDEVRDKLANDPDSGYDISTERELPEPPPPELPPGFGGGEPGGDDEGDGAPPQIQ